jgi:hypothetical protein
MVVGESHVTCHPPCSNILPSKAELENVDPLSKLARMLLIFLIPKLEDNHWIRADLATLGKKLQEYKNSRNRKINKTS